MSSYFVPVSLPKWEITLSFAVWIFHSLAAFLISYYASTGSVHMWVSRWLEPSSYFSALRFDNSDPEWRAFRLGIWHMVSSNFLNSIGFFCLTKYLSGSSLQYSLIILGIVTQIHLTSFPCILLILAFTLLVIGITVKTRSKVLAWVLCIAFVIKAPNYLPFTIGPHTYYREFNVYLYNAFKLLNFSLYLCNNHTIRYRDIIMDHFLYVSYLPYSMSLIVLYEDFQTQIKKRLSEKTILPDKKKIFFGVRILFWMVFYDFLLHVIHVNALFSSPFVIINSLNNYELASIAYVTGQFFHIKYVVIFGVPSFFASIDGMIPPPPPICISRVTRYSRMWRNFDYGLYQFLKHHVYIPLMKPSLPTPLSVLRNIGTLVAVFSVVIAWHGARYHYLCWVSLSALELIIEKIGQFVWSTEKFQKVRKIIGERNTRRIIALSMLLTVVPGIFGVFFFLGQDGIGETIFNRLLVQGIHDLSHFNIAANYMNAGFVFGHLLVLGYFFNQVCIELDRHRLKRE